MTVKLKVAALLAEGVRRLRASPAGSAPEATPDLDAQVLLAQVLGVARVRLRSTEQFDVTKDRHTGLPGRGDHGMRLGEAVRDAGRQHQRADAVPVDRRQIVQWHLAGNRGAGLLIVIPGEYLGAARRQRGRRRPS